ncbi:hypothetical protein LCGC14_2945350 [marine sediment metagenome]|uniref:Uncharacterized protein n=1 Tax=marine sediment metagenome TaxID=412755 RepID=A0A0F8XGM0_9ZZZZ
MKTREQKLEDRQERLRSVVIYYCENYPFESIFPQWSFSRYIKLFPDDVGFQCEIQRKYNGSVE